MLMLVEHWTPMCFLKGLDTIEGWPDEDEDVICKPFTGSESVSYTHLTLPTNREV